MAQVHPLNLICTLWLFERLSVYFHSDDRSHQRQGSERTSHLPPALEEDLELHRRSIDDSQELFSRHEGQRKGERPLPNLGHGSRNTPSPGHLDEYPRHSPVPAYGRSSPLAVEMQEDPSGELSPIPRFESPNSVHSDEGIEIDPPLVPSRRMRNVPPVRVPSEPVGPAPPLHLPEDAVAQPSIPRRDGPNAAQRFEGHKGPQSSYDGPPGHMGKPRSEAQPPRPHPPNVYEGNPGSKRYDGPGNQRFDSHSRYDSNYGQRFEAPPPHEKRFDGGPGRYDGSGPHRPMRFEGPHSQQGFGRYERPLGHGRFEGPAPGPGPNRFEGPIQPNRFEAPPRFNNPHMQQGPARFDGPMGYTHGNMGPPSQPGPMRFDGPNNQPSGMCYENPAGPPGPIRFEGTGGMPRLECPPPPGPPRYFAPQNQMRPQNQPMFNVAPGPGPGPAPMVNPVIQQPANFNMTNRFPEPFGGNTQPFPAQPNVPQGPNFNVPQVPTSTGFPNSFRPVAPFQPVGLPLV